MAHRINIFRQTTAIIHLDNLASNYQNLKRINGDKTFFCPMVKANAYGHGDVEIALRLQDLGVTTMGVGLVEEGLLLRQMGVRCELLVFGIFDAPATREILHHRLTPVISVWQQLEALSNATPVHDSRIPIHLKFDTGMHRLGFAVSEAQKLYDYLRQHPRLQVKGICTHLFRGEDAADLNGDSLRQLALFQEVERIFSPLQPISHTLNSAGALNFHQLRENKVVLPSGISLNQGVRIGLLIYGLSPMPEIPSAVSFKPVMSLRSHVVRYHRLKANETVSYGGTWKASRETVVGVIPIGYADGYHRLLSNKAEVLVKGRRVPQIGNVCMDFIIVDVTGVMTDAEIENNIEIEATLFGLDSMGNLLSAAELAKKAQTISYEILTSVGERVPRVIETDEAAWLRKGKEVGP